MNRLQFLTRPLGPTAFEAGPTHQATQLGILFTF